MASFCLKKERYFYLIFNIQTPGDAEPPVCPEPWCIWTQSGFWSSLWSPDLVTTPRAGGSTGILWKAWFRHTIHLLQANLQHYQEFNPGIQNQCVAENSGERSRQDVKLPISLVKAKSGNFLAFTEPCILSDKWKMSFSWARACWYPCPLEATWNKPPCTYEYLGHCLWSPKKESKSEWSSSGYVDPYVNWLSFSPFPLQSSLVTYVSPWTDWNSLWADECMLAFNMSWIGGPW